MKFKSILQEQRQGLVWDIEALVDRGGILTLRLICGQSRLELRFSSYRAYRKRDEGEALTTLSALKTAGCLTDCFFEVEDSEFLEWYRLERGYKKDAETIKHILITTLDDVIDIIETNDASVATQFD